MQQKLTLSAEQFVVLSIITLAKKGLAVSEIAKEAEKIGLQFSNQSLANIASRLYRDNLVSIKMSAPRPIVGGHPRKLYQINKKGLHELETTGKFFLLLLSMKSAESE